MDMRMNIALQDDRDFESMAGVIPELALA